MLFQSSIDTTDADGNLVTEVDAAGDTSTFQYNHLHEPRSRRRRPARRRNLARSSTRRG